MKITGVQKLTLLDYPGRVACTVFLQGCNFRCPFCHNGQLLEGCETAPWDTAALLDFLKKRKGLLDGVCITGGEPTLNDELPKLLESIHALGCAVKLDTNGSNPEMLAGLLNRGLVDYVAMDVKNSPERYPETVCRQDFDLSATEESMRLLIGGTVDYELRTTVVGELHSRESIRQMGEWAAALCPGKKIKNWFLQYFVDRDTVLRPGLTAPTQEEMSDYVGILSAYANKIEIRG